MRRPKTTHSCAVLLLLALAGCGGGSTSPSPNPPPAPPPAPPPPPPAPAPVATVTVTPPTASLVPQQTQALTAATLDGSGNPLSGRAVAWTTSAPAVATVSSAGLVTAAAAGSATITATSEGKAGTATITVAEGGSVGVAGGTVNAVSGAVKIAVPAGAIAAPLVVTVAPNPTPPALPMGTYSVKGTSYTFGPEGTTFSSPATVTLKYDPAKLPAWALPGDLAVYHYTGGAWVKLPNLVVDPVARTVTAKTTSFSPFTIGVNLPLAVISPKIGSVSLLQRSVVFTASIPGRASTGLQFAWATTAMNGAMSSLPGGDGQYTMTQAQMPPGDLDQVQVIVRGNIDPATPNVVVPLASAEALVNANLKFTYDLLPDLGNMAFGQARTLDAGIHNTDGSVYSGSNNLPILMTWTSTELHGALNLHNPNHKTAVTKGVFTAKALAQSAKLPPRIDKFTVDFYVGYLKSYTHVQAATPVSFARSVLDSVVPRFDVKSGTAIAFVEVEPKTILANFLVRTTPSPGGSCVAAVAVVPIVAGVNSYDLTVTGIVNGPNGPTFHKVVTGPENTGSLLDVYSAGAFLGVPMAGGCNTTPAGITGRQNAYQAAFGPATYVVKTP